MSAKHASWGRLRAVLRRWRRAEGGVAAVEGAIAGAIVAIGAVGLVNAKYGLSLQAALSDSLRVSAEYVERGGADLTKAQAALVANLGRDATLTARLLCVTRPTLTQSGTLDPAAADQLVKGAQPFSAQSSPGVWSLCPASTDIRFVEMTAKSVFFSMVSQKETIASASIVLMLGV